jgi:reactive chlorine resistance protein C
MTEQVAKLDRFAALTTRLGLVVMTLWIGGLKVTHYEAEGIVAFVSNSPWHHANGTYQVCLMIVSIGVLIALGIHYPAAGVIGGILLAAMSLVILSALVMTEVWFPTPGAATHGFPFLAVAGRFAAKGAIMVGASLGCAADSARRLVVKRAGPVEDSTLVSYWGR